MKNFLTKFLIGCGVAVSILIPSMTAVTAVRCPDGTARSGESLPSYAECSTEATTGDDSLMSRVKVIINVVLGILGVVAVAMIIVGGIMYTTSQGNPDKVKQAKDIVIYSIVGLVVALLGFAIVNFVMVNVFR